MTDTAKAWIEERRGIHAEATEGPWSYIKDTRSDGFPVFRVGSDETGEDILSIPRYRHEWDGVHIADSVTDAHNNLPRALDALEQVLELHKPMPDGNCVSCTWFSDGNIVPHPCATVRAIEGAING